MIRTVRNCASSFAILLSIFMFLGGCTSSIKLGAYIEKKPKEITFEEICNAKYGAECLNEQKPSYSLTVPDKYEILLSKPSPDGKYHIITTTQKKETTKPTGIYGRSNTTTDERVTVIGYDIEHKKELWQMKLAAKRACHAWDCYFVQSKVVVFRPQNNSLIGVKIKDGSEVWRFDNKKQGLAVLYYFDAEYNYFIVGTNRKIFIINALDGSVLDSKDRVNLNRGIIVSGSQPYLSGENIYLYDYGLVKISRPQKKIVWATPFVTFGENDHTGKNVTMAVLAIAFGSVSSTTPPDFWIGRNSVPVEKDGKVIASGMGVVHCLNAKNGELVWSVDLQVEQIGKIAVYLNRVYLFAGGQHVFWKGFKEMSVHGVNRHGLYCLDLSSGQVIEQFKSPCNNKGDLKHLALSEVKKYDEDDAWEEEEDWIRADKRKLKKLKADKEEKFDKFANKPYTLLKLKGMEQISNSVMIATPQNCYLLDKNSGSVKTKVDCKSIKDIVTLKRIGDMVVVRGLNGIAVIDAISSTLLWEKCLESSKNYAFYRNTNCEGFIHTMMYQSFLQSEHAELAKGFYWYDRVNNAVIVPIQEDSTTHKLVALNLQNGDNLWSHPIDEKSHFVLDYVNDIPTLSFNNGQQTAVYRITPSTVEPKDQIVYETIESKEGSDESEMETTKVESEGVSHDESEMETTKVESEGVSHDDSTVEKAEVESEGDSYDESEMEKTGLENEEDSYQE